MSKGLEVLKLCEERDGILIRTEINIIRKELQRLEAIDNVQPSEALESLEYLGSFKLETDIYFGSTNSFP